MNNLSPNTANKPARSTKTLRMVQMAMLAAISIVLVLVIRIPFAPAPYLEFDLADVPVMLGAFMLGPVYGLIVLLVVCIIQAFLLGGNGIIGLIMHFVASGVLVVVSSLIHKALGKKTWGLIVALVVGCIAMAAVMIPLNIFFTPILFGTAREVVISLIVPVLIPFNLLKAGINSVIFFVFFKGFSLVMNRRKSDVM